MNLSIVIEYYKAHLHYNNGNIHTHTYTRPCDLGSGNFVYIHYSWGDKCQQSPAMWITYLYSHGSVQQIRRLLNFPKAGVPCRQLKWEWIQRWKFTFFAYQSHSNGWFDQSLRWDFDRAIWARFPLLVSSEIVRRRRPNKCYILYICSP